MTDFSFELSSFNYYYYYMSYSCTNGGVGATCRRLCSISEILYDLLGMCVCVSLSLNPTCFPLFPFLLFPLSAWGGGRWMCEKQEICFCPCQFCSTEH